MNIVLIPFMKLNYEYASASHLHLRLIEVVYLIKVIKGFVRRSSTDRELIIEILFTPV